MTGSVSADSSFSILVEKPMARTKFQSFRAVLLTGFIKELRRLAQCSGSETLKGFFFLVHFSFDLSKEKRTIIDNYL